MPSRRVKSVAINERISEAQKGRTRLACRVCRSRRIKCDGQKGMCGRCRLDKRPDCSYENVGSAERMAGRQRKRARRKHLGEDSASASTEQDQGSSSISQPLPPPHQLNWTSPVLTTKSPIMQSPQHLIQNNYHPQRTPVKREQPPESEIQQRRPVNMTPISSTQSSSNRGDEAYQASYQSLPLSSIGSTGGATVSMSMADGYPTPHNSWVGMSPPSGHYQQSNGTVNGNGHLPSSSSIATGQPLDPSAPSHDYPSDQNVDLGSIDSLWRVYDWQYRCNSGMPSQYPSQTAGGPPTFTP